MIQNTANKPIAELFSSDNSVSYFIPKYQREYIWSKNNWEALFDDIEESDGGHFLGSIICINTERDTMKPAVLELVDGQQRMTTISLFYLAILSYLIKHIPDQNNWDSQLELMSLKNRITLNDRKSIRITPSYSNQNIEDYKWIFANVINEMHKISKPKNLGNRQLARAFNYFYSRLENKDEMENPNYNYESGKILLNKLNSATIVKIDVASHADAFTLFETLNNRGVPLSAIDLIKNKLLGYLERCKKTSTIDDNFNRWNQIIKNLTDDYAVQERFLRHFYNAFKLEEKVAVKGKHKALRSNLINIYEALIERDVEFIFQSLEKSSEIYSKNIQYEIDDHSSELINSLRNMENVNGSDGYMLLLFIEKHFTLCERDKIELVNLLCKYFIRRNVTDTPPTRDLTNIFIEIIEELDETMKSYDYRTVLSVIKEKGKLANDDLFKSKLNGDLYEENVGATRYILSTIETVESKTRERYTNFYSRNKNNFIWTIEHVFPQGENIPKDWIDMIGEGNEIKAKEIQKSHVHRLGNLTLTAYNSNLSNLSLSKKQDRKDSEGKYIGFKNGLWLNDKLKDTPKWTKEDIEERTKLLVIKALEIFGL